MKVRVFHDGNRVLLIERDPMEEYSDKFYPHRYLVDGDAPEKGYKDVPECFVMEESPVLEQKFEHLKVRKSKSGMEVYFDQDSKDEEDYRKKKERGEFKSRIDAISDPKAAELLTEIAKKFDLID